MLIRHEIDIRNLSVMLRNTAFYHFPADRIRDFLLDGGTLTAKTLAEWSSARSVEELVSRLPLAFADRLANLAGQQLHHYENALWTGLWHQCRALFNDTDAPQNALLAFPFLLRFETDNLMRAYEAVRFGLPAADLKKMLICDPWIAGED